MADKDKQLVFDRFKCLVEKNKVVKGSGLGLAITQRIVELHGGKIGINDNPSCKGGVCFGHHSRKHKVLFSNILIPDVRLFTNKFFHNFLTFCYVKIDNFDTVLFHKVGGSFKSI